MLAGGGKLPGYGGGDKVSALLEKGEFVVRKEAVKNYGSNFFQMLNDMGGKIPSAYSSLLSGLSGGRQKYQTGGYVSGMDVRDYGRVELQVGSKAYPVMGKQSVIEDLKEALRREQLVST